MRWFSHSPIRAKLMLLSLGPSLLILVLSGITFLAFDWFLYKRGLEADLEANAQFIARTTRAALAFNASGEALQILDGLRVKETIFQAVIYDETGAVFAALDPRRIDLLPPREGLQEGLSSVGNRLFFVQPIQADGKHLGTLYLASSLEGAYDRLLLFTASAFLALLLFALLAYLLASRLQSLIATPILELAETARTVSERQDYSLRAKKRSTDEVGFLTDSFNRMLEEIQSTIGELEAFSYTVSHDLRAPLRAMQGYAQALQEDHGERLNDEAACYLARISVAGKRLDCLIQDVLTYSRVIRSEVTPAPVDLDKLVHDVLQQYPTFQSPNLDITVLRPLHKPMGNETLLTQCIANLLDNAIKFVSPGKNPAVKVWTEKRDGRVRFWVQDNGIGIEPKYQQRIFRMFERIHHQDQYEGTGIGLSIVCKAVERMGGRFGVESEVGGGSRFWLDLPEAS